MSKQLDWIKRNRKFLNIRAIAGEIKMSPRTLQGFVADQQDGHGTPFKVPEKYHKSLIELIKGIQKH